MTNKEKFLALVTEQDNSVLEQIKWRRENRTWLNRSQKVSMLILRILREQKISQKELANRLNVSPQQVNKWVKGNENFTFETISRIENVLNIQLLSVPGFENQIANVVYPTQKMDYQQVVYQPVQLRKKRTSSNCIPFIQKVPLNDFDKAI